MAEGQRSASTSWQLTDRVTARTSVDGRIKAIKLLSIAGHIGAEMKKIKCLQRVYGVTFLLKRIG